MLDELKKYNQWVVVNPEQSKSPLQINGKKAGPINPKHWSSYDKAIKAIEKGIGTHVGFVLTEQDPFVIIDLDNKKDDSQIQEEIDLIVKQANHNKHYVERSYSDKGYHIIYIGTQYESRRTDFIEFYTNARMVILTLNANGNKVKMDREGIFDQLYNSKFRNPIIERGELVELPQVHTDEEVMRRFSSAYNGRENIRLYTEQITGQDDSVLDQSLIERLCFHTECNEQVRRLFRNSVRGQREKVLLRWPEYVNRSIAFSRSKKVPVVDVSQLQPDRMEKMKSSVRNPVLEFPPGPAGLLSEYFFINSIQPIKVFAIANALTLLAGIVGRRFLFRNSTINLFTLIIGESGSGKDASRKPLYYLKKALDDENVLIGQFLGPESASGQALFASLETQPSYSVYMGEFADELLMISNIKASDNNRHLANSYLRLYDEHEFAGKVHRDSSKNIKAIQRPAVSIMGSGTPEFFEGVSDHAIKRGLIPRFIILEHLGSTPAFNDREFAHPHPKIIDHFKVLLKEAVKDDITEVPYANSEAENLSMKYRKEMVLMQDKAETIIERGLYNRIHLNICRVATILAACDQPKNPRLTVSHLKWAYSYLMYSLSNLTVRYKFGTLGNNMALQREASIIKMFNDWYLMLPRKRAIYCKGLMDKELFVPKRYLNNRCQNLSCFTEYPAGYTRAFNDTIQHLIDIDEIVQLDLQTLRSHGVKSRFVYAKSH